MLRRDTAKLQGAAYDVVVVGAGIYGACLARDAALRGLRVALIDRGDFGCATSHNSLKLIHGGLRYIQQGAIRRVRQSARERRAWLNIAPHLIRPLKFVIPTFGHATRGPEAFFVALKLYNLLTGEATASAIPQQAIPSGQVISKRECLDLIPGLELRGITGGAVWYDGQMLDSDRVLLECVLDAATAGADVSNYVAAEGFLWSGERIAGVQAKDLLSDDPLEIRSALTVNAAGPWVQALLQATGRSLRQHPLSGLSKGLNLVTKKIFGDHAVGVPGRGQSDSLLPRGGRLYFITPWQDRSIIGTTHIPFDDESGAFRLREEDIEMFIAEVNAAYPPAALKREDVVYCYSGLTPADSGLEESNKRPQRGAIIDHERADRLGGLISVLGIKYTTARLVSENVVDLVFEKLGRKPIPCVSAERPLPGSEGYRSRSDLEREATAQLGNRLEPDEVSDVIKHYGTRYQHVLDIGEYENGSRDALFRCRCRFAVRAEMAVRLEDLVLRRSVIAAKGLLTQDRLICAANLMAKELGWSEQKKRSEIDEVRRTLSSKQGAKLPGSMESALGV